MSDAARQHSIDLMPEAIRARGQAGMRMGQFTVFAVVAMTATIVVATHSKIALSTSQERLFETAGQAEQVFATEARAAELRHELESIRSYTRQYERLAFPLEIGDVLATVVNSLPASVTLDQVDLNAGARVIGRTARSKAVDGAESSPRVLSGEISGFTATDQEIAELLSTLEATPPFDHVSLDFSRGRRVNDHDAREFRLSFRIDLDARYSVARADAREAPAAGAKEVADANH